jgi:hypothetical protein
MTLTIDELYKRLSSFYNNVEKSHVILTNNNLTIVNEDESGVKTFIKAKGSMLIKPFDLCYHKAIFFEKVGLLEIQSIFLILQEIQNKALEKLKLNVKIGNEDNLIVKNEDLIFTGKVIIETNHFEIPKNEVYDIVENLNIKFGGNKLKFVMKDNENWEKMDKSKFTKVFLCHDSRDKDFVKNIHFELTKKSVRSWLDEYELKIGDSLTDKIKEGLNNSDYGVIFLSKNFLSNEKWVKYELQTLMSKQIYLNQKIILPVWLDIEEKDLENHYWLKEKVAANSKDGLDNVVKQIIQAIN